VSVFQGANTREPSRKRFIACELALWALVYPLYLAIRSWSIGAPGQAIADAWRVIRLERALGAFHEAALQRAVSGADDVFSVYYMLGFGPLTVAVLVWLGLRRRDLYRRLRTLLLVSLAIATIGYVLYPTAPPRLVPGLGIDDTVGLSSGHDGGSFLGIRFDPYAAMPSMHVGWGLLLAVVCFRAVPSGWLRAGLAVHPALMAFAVTATGNHYFADSAGGAVAALLAFGLVTGAAALRRPTRRHETPARPVAVPAWTADRERGAA
jgi:4-amino-4-deoxy-L-arabinose transferase-like glycosyltransferase